MKVPARREASIMADDDAEANAELARSYILVTFFSGYKF